jgi:MFS family permease
MPSSEVDGIARLVAYSASLFDADVACGREVRLMFSLLRVRDFGLLWFAGLISYIGNFGLIVVLPLHIYQQTNSTLATAGLLAANTLPRILFGSFAGVLVDRWDRRLVMQWSDTLRAIAILSILVAPDSLSFLYTVAAVQGIVRLFFGPAENALLPLLVDRERLVTANALNALNNQLGMLIGPAIATGIYGYWGIRPAIIVVAICYLVSATLISFIRSNGRLEQSHEDGPIGESPLGKLKREWIDGIQVVRGSRTLSTLFATHSLNSVAEGFFITLGLGPFVIDVLQGTEAQVGWLSSAQSIGGLIAGLIVVKFVHRFAVRGLFILGHGLIGLCDALTFSARFFMSAGNPAVIWSLGWMLVVGFPVIAAMTGQQSLMQNATTDRHRGRVYGAMGTLDGICMMIGIGLAGVLGQWMSIQPLLIGSALLRIAGALIAAKYLPNKDESDDHRTELNPATTGTTACAA